MATLAPGSDEAKRIDASLQEWRQGDLALDESWFVHVGDGAAPHDMPANDYVESDPLDLDHLPTSKGE